MEEFTPVTSSVIIGVSAASVLTVIVTGLLLIGVDWQTSIDLFGGFGGSTNTLPLLD